MSEPSTARAIVANQLALDAATAELTQALRDKGVDSVLLKGPVVARHLYADPAQRDYGDVDLLIEPGGETIARDVLAALGYRRMLVLTPGERPQHAEPWQRGGPRPATIDLHTTVKWARVDRAAVWRAFSEGADSLSIDGVAVTIPGEAARALGLALHACQHGPTTAKPLTDLALGLATLDGSVWEQARVLAERLRCLDAFAAGLRLAPGGGGAALAERLGLPERGRVEVHLMAGDMPPIAGAFAWLAAMPSRRARIAYIAHKLVPSPEFMREWEPIARRGPLGLAAAYLRRLFVRAWSAPGGVRALERARRSAGQATIADALRPRSLAATWWACSAARRTRRRLRREPLDAVRVAPPPRIAHSARRGVGAGLRVARATCLEQALVRQAWHGAHGLRRTVVVGVTAPSEGFGAHAWLEGDDPQGEFAELLRLP